MTGARAHRQPAKGPSMGPGATDTRRTGHCGDTIGGSSRRLPDRGSAGANLRVRFRSDQGAGPRSCSYVGGDDLRLCVSSFFPVAGLFRSGALPRRIGTSLRRVRSLLCPESGVTPLSGRTFSLAHFATHDECPCAGKRLHPSQFGAGAGEQSLHTPRRAKATRRACR
jgi:hypothetical protein